MAPIPFEFACDMTTGFLPEPREQKRVGYLTDFNGLDVGFGPSNSLAKDLQVFFPYPKPTYAPLGDQVVNGKVKVIGVLETFVWNGGVSDPLQFVCYVSQQSAIQLETLQQRSLKTISISSFGWWITDYDQETRTWYEQSYPLTPEPGGQFKGQINIDVSNPMPVAEGIDVKVYQVSFEIVPAVNRQYALHFAKSSTQSVVKSWGLAV